MRIVLAHGTFDLLHMGHLQYFKRAKEYGDKLIVSVTSNRWVMKGLGRPIFDEKERMEMIAAIKYVDNVILSDTENSVTIINMIKPAVYAKGPDYSKADPTGNLEKERIAVESHGGRLVIIHNEIVYSSTEIMNGALLQKRIAQCQES